MFTLLMEISPLILVALIVILLSLTLLVDVSRFYLSYLLIIPPAIFTYLLTGTLFYTLALILAVIVVKTLYTKRFFLYGALLFSIAVSILLVANHTLVWELFDFSLGYGGVISLLGDRISRVNVRTNDISKGKERKIEVRRDYVQIGGGTVVLVLLAVSSFYSIRIIITVAVIGFYIVGNHYSMEPQSRIGRLIYYFERSGSPLGLGAVWFGMGILFSLGVVDSGKIFSIIIFGSTIGDPLATIVGSGIHSFPLPFNRRKSVAGFLAMLLPTCIVGYILAGYVGLAVAVTGTFAESISIHTLDDNFTVPASMGIISRLIQAIL